MWTKLNSLVPPIASLLNTYVNNPFVLVNELNGKSQGELEHQRVKHFYKRTNKGVTFPHQIAKQERMQRHYQKYVETIMKKTGTKSQSISQSKGTNSDDTSPRRHYSISERSCGYLGLYQWAYGKDTYDPALKAFIPARSHRISY